MNRTVVITCIVSLVVSGGIGLVYYYVHTEQASQAVLTPITVGYRNLTAEVQISGSTKASDTVDLSFKNGGIVAAVPIAIGDSVSTRTTLMILRSTTIGDQISQAQADFNVQLAKLRDLKNGTRPEQIAVTQAKLESGGTTLTSARQGLLDALSHAQSTTDVTVRFTIDQFITNPMMFDSQLTIPVSDSQLGFTVLDERRQIGSELSLWSARIATLQSANANDLLSASASMHEYLQSISIILDGVTRILASSNSAQVITNQASVAAARATINATDGALTTATQQVRDAQSVIGVIGQQLALEKAGATTESVLAQQAVVDSARAQVVELKNELLDQSIKAPFDGIITAVNAKQGETVATGETVVSMISNGQLKIEGFVPEIHYNEITVGQPVNIQLDAFPGISFPGMLAHIDPSAILQGGVPNFKVTVYFTNSDEHIKPGLTAQAFIHTSEKTNVLALPLAAVTGVGSSATAIRLVGTTPGRVHVVLGIIGIDGYVEILSGLNAGDIVLENDTKQYRAVPN